MKRKAGTPRIYLASSGMGNMPVANMEERLLSLLATLEECRDFLMDKASPETARLLSLAILELRMELHQVTDSELKALCELMEAEDRKPQESNSARHCFSGQDHDRQVRHVVRAPWEVIAIRRAPAGDRRATAACWLPAQINTTASVG